MLAAVAVCLLTRLWLALSVTLSPLLATVAVAASVLMAVAGIARFWRRSGRGAGVDTGGGAGRRQREPLLADGSLIDALPQALLMVDPAGRIRYLNAAAATLLGHEPQTLLDAPLQRLLPDAARSGHPQLMASYFAAPQPRPMGSGRDLHCLRADGSLLPVEIGLNPVQVGEERVVVAAITDISERQAHRQALERMAASLEAQVAERTAQLAAANARWKRRNAGLTLINELLGLLPVCATRSELCEVVSSYLARIFPASSGAIYLLEDGVFRRQAAWGEGTPVAEIRPQDCWALRRGKIHVACAAGGRPSCAHGDCAPVDACMAICGPLTVDGRIAGLTHLEQPRQVEGPQAEGPSPEEAELLMAALGENTSMALQSLRLQDRLRDQAMRDPLTGLYNRRHVSEAAARALAQIERRGGTLSIVLADLDHFKRLNDRFGHAIGDLALQQLSRRMQEVLREGDLLGRHGGEEFVILLPDTDLAGASGMAERLRRAISDERIRGEHQVTASFGVASSPEHGSSFEALLRRADAALYAAKDAGRDCVRTAADGQPRRLDIGGTRGR